MTGALHLKLYRAENRANDLESSIFRALLNLRTGKIQRAREILENAAPNLAAELDDDPAGPFGGRAA